MDITIVTALYDIRSKEPEDDGPRKINDYIALGRSMLDIDLPMIIFTDDMTVYKETERYRTEKDLHEKTMIVQVPFEETFFYKDLDLLKQRMEEYTLFNRNPAKDTPLYVLVNNNKFDFLERAMAQNPFGSDFFFWMDYGIQHCAKASPADWASVANEWPAYIRQDRTHIHQLRIHPTKKDDAQTWKDYFHTIYHHIGGSCFGGYRDCVLEYSRLFKEQWDTMLHKEGWWQLDEAIMTIITETWPEKFRFWYGDYDGLITNFITSKRSWHLIFNLCQHHLDRRDYLQSEAVLTTLDPAMKDLPADDPSFLRYLILRITSDFYRFRGDFSPALSAILFREENPVPPVFLEMQMSNLVHYHSKQAMLFLARWSFRDNLPALGRFHPAEDAIWIPMGNRCLSALALDHQGERETSFPLDYVEFEPRQALRLFRKQFLQFYTPNDSYTNPYGIFFEHHQKNTHADNQVMFERRIQRLYQHLETPSRSIVFFHTTELFLMKKYSLEEQLAYDQELVALAEYLERNYPDVTFHFLVLLTNRKFHASHDKIIPIRIMTPLAYTSTMSKNMPVDQLFSYREAIYDWLRFLKKKIN